MIRDGPQFVSEIAAEIVDERGVQRDWLKQFGTMPRSETAMHRMAIRERLLRRVLGAVTGLAERCVAVARRPDAGKLKGRCALAVSASLSSSQAGTQNRMIRARCASRTTALTESICLKRIRPWQQVLLKPLS